MKPDALEEQLGGLDLTDPEAMQALGGFADAGALLGAMRSDRQEPLLEELQRFVSVLEGYADVVVETLGERMVSAHERHRRSAAPAPARARRRGRRSSTACSASSSTAATTRTGVAFCRGVVERAGLDGLNRLWEGERWCRPGRARRARTLARPHRASTD